MDVRQNPLVLGEVPDALLADDAALQQNIIDSLRDAAGDPERSSTRYEDLPVRRIPLSKFQQMMEMNQVQAAFKLLRSRNEIFVDEKFSYDPKDRDLAYDVTQHHLDFLMVLSSRIGFDAFLPNSPNDMTFIFNLDLHQPHRPLKMKHCDLGFPLDRNALYIGRSRGKDLIYLVMAPNAFINEVETDEDAPDYPNSHASSGRPRTNMSGKHYFMLVMFMAHVFQKHFPRRDIYCHVRYPDIERNAWRNVRDSTNLLYVPLLSFS